MSIDRVRDYFEIVANYEEDSLYIKFWFKTRIDIYNSYGRNDIDTRFIDRLRLDVKDCCGHITYNKKLQYVTIREVKYKICDNANNTAIKRDTFHNGLVASEQEYLENFLDNIVRSVVKRKVYVALG